MQVAASRCSHRTTCGIGASHCWICVVPWARIGEFVGQRNLAVTANTHTHVLVDESKVDCAALLARGAR